MVDVEVSFCCFSEEKMDRNKVNFCISFEINFILFLVVRHVRF